MIKIIDFQPDNSDHVKQWEKVHSLSSNSWIFSLYDNFCFLADKAEALNSSKLIYKDRDLIGVMPLVTVLAADGTKQFITDDGIPIPFFLRGVGDKLYKNALSEVVDSFFSNEASNAATAKWACWKFGHFDELRFDEWRRRLSDYDAIEHFFETIYLTLPNWSEDDVRASYSKGIRKYGHEYEFSMLDGLTHGFIEDYAEIHNLDSGLSQPKESFYERLKPIAHGNGRVFQALHVKSKRLAGVLVVYHDKTDAYDGSVAIHPDFASEYVAHALKVFAIRRLKTAGFFRYILGERFLISHAPDQRLEAKKKNISFFKEGFGEFKTGMSSRFIWEPPRHS